MKWILVLAVGVLGSSIGVFAVSANQSVANIDLRVWQSTSDSKRIYVSARAEGEAWQPTTRVTLDDENSAGTWRYGDIAIEVALPGPTFVYPGPGPVTTFQVQLHANSRGEVAASIQVPVALRSDVLDLRMQAENGARRECYSSYAILPADGMTAIECNGISGPPETVESMRATVEIKSEDGASLGEVEYRCNPVDDPAVPANRWLCRQFQFDPMWP